MMLLFAHGDWISVALSLAADAARMVSGVLSTLMFVLAIDLAVGAGLLAVWNRKRHLVWALPLFNCLAFAILTWTFAAPERRAELLRPPDLYFTLGFAAALTACGWVTLALLTPFQLAIRAWNDRRRSGAGKSRPIDPPLDIHVPAVTDRWPAFREGLSAPWQGLLYLCRRPSLWRYGLLPIGLNIVITFVVLVILVAVTVAVFTDLHQRFPEGTGWILLEVLVGLLLLLFALGGAFVTWLLLLGVLCGYFHGQLAKQVEIECGLRAEDIRDITLAQQFVDTLRDVATLVGIYAGLLCLQLVPVLGSIGAAVGGWAFTSYCLGADCLEYPLSLLGWRLAERRVFTRRHRWHVLGLGTTVLLVQLIPLLGSVLLTGGVVGAVLLHRRLALIAPPVQLDDVAAPSM